MKKMSKKREVFLSVFLSVAMVLTYMAAPMLPILGLQESNSAFAESYEGFDLSTSGEYDDRTPTTLTVVEGYDEVTWRFLFWPSVRSYYDEETGRKVSIKTDEYYKFDIEGEDSESFSLSGAIITETYLPDDEDWMDDGGSNLWVTMNTGMPAGEYQCSLNVYYDPTGTGTFGDPEASIPFSITVISAEELFVLSIPEGGAFEFTEVEGDITDLGGCPVCFNSAISTYEESSSPKNYLRFELAGEQPNAFMFGGDEFLETIQKGENCFYIQAQSGLSAGTYHAVLNMYVDPQGKGEFGDPMQSIEVVLTVERKASYEIKFEELWWDATSSEGRFLAIKNTGIKKLYIDPAKLEISGEADLFEVELTGETPVAVSPGDSCRVAFIRPLKSNASQGEHSISLHLIAEDGVAETWATAGFISGVSLIADPKSVDFGVLKTNEVAGCSQEIELKNFGGYRPILITGIEIPASGVFKAVLPESDTVIETDESISFSIALDSDSQEARQGGVFQDSYIVHATEADWDYDWDEDVRRYYPLPGGQSIDLRIPVRVEISDEAYKITINAQGHGQNMILNNISKGENVYEAASSAFNESFAGDTPTAEGFIYGGLSRKPLTAFTKWDDFFDSQNALMEESLTGDTTLYAVWFPELSGIGLNTEAPVCGTNAADNAPIINAQDQTRYSVREETWVVNEEDSTPYTGTIEGGQEYHYRAFVRTEFPYVFADGLNVIVDGKAYDASHCERDINAIELWPYPAKKATHNLEKVDGIKATCTTPGIVAHYICKGCGKEFGDATGAEELTEVVVPVNNDHDWGDWIELIAPTCEDTGVKYHVCKYNGIHMEMSKIPAAGHVLTHIDAKAATCDQAGSVEHYVCENCGKIFADAGGSTELKDIEVPPTDHAWGEWNVLRVSTCIETGLRYRVCKDNTLHLQFEETPLDPNNHVHLINSAFVKATPKADGKTDGSVCNDCGSVLKAVERIPQISSVTLSSTSYTYSRQAKKPSVTVKDANGDVISSEHYAVKYTDNVNAGSASSAKAPTVTITFNSKYYSGTITQAFTIKPQSIEKLYRQYGEVYDNGNIYSIPQILGHNAEVGDWILQPNVDFTYTAKHSGGKCSYTITGKGNYSGTISGSYKSYYQGNGKDFHTKTLKSSSGKHVIYYEWWDQDLCYWNRPVEVSVCAFKVVDGYLIGDYNACKIIYKNNRYPGKATCNCKFSNETVSFTFKISPPTTSIWKATSGSKKFTVEWDKTAQTTGYQIYYTTSTTAPKATTKPKATIGKASTVSKTITGLKGGKKYYVYVRSYKTVNGVKYYSPWSPKKAVTTKK